MQALQPKTQQNAEPWATGAEEGAHPHQASLALPHWGTRSDLPLFSGGRSSSQHAVTPSFLYISFISVPQLPPHTSFPHRSRAEGDVSALRGRAAARRAAPAPSSPPPRLPAAFPGPGPPPSSSVHRRRRGRSRGGFTERRWVFLGGNAAPPPLRAGLEVSQARRSEERRKPLNLAATSRGRAPPGKSS